VPTMRVVRSKLERFGGQEVDTTGDGFFATFDGPACAVPAQWPSAMLFVRSTSRSGLGSTRASWSLWTGQRAS